MEVIPPMVAEPVETPPDTQHSEPRAAQDEPVTHSKRCTAALLLGAGTFVFAVLTMTAYVLKLDLRLLGTLATGAFFLAPLACCFGILGIAVRIKHKRKRGLPSAIIGLLLGLCCGLVTAYLLLARILGLSLPF